MPPEAPFDGTEGRPVDVLWTGGWDSTFRVLDLAIRQGRHVRPHYVIKQARRSHRHELAAMDRVRQSVLERFGAEVAVRIGALHCARTEALPPNPQARKWLEALRKDYPLYDQYVFLNSYARLNGLTRLDIGVQGGDALRRFLLPHLIRDGDALRLADRPANPAMELFRPFRFPILETLKPETAQAAQRAGFAPEMELTHFCAEPSSRGRACGRCIPCQQVIEQGMGYRIPWPARLHLRCRENRLYRGALAIRRALVPLWRGRAGQKD